MACSETCELTHWFGASGTCNETTLLCECPDGFDGRDEWLVANDCHVDQKLYRVVSLIKMGMSITTIFWGIWTLLFLMRYWGFLRKDSHEIDPNPTPDSPKNAKSSHPLLGSSFRFRLFTKKKSKKPDSSSQVGSMLPTAHWNTASFEEKDHTNSEVDFGNQSMVATTGVDVLHSQRGSVTRGSSLDVDSLGVTADWAKEKSQVGRMTVSNKVVRNATGSKASSHSGKSKRSFLLLGNLLERKTSYVFKTPVSTPKRLVDRQTTFLFVMCELILFGFSSAVYVGFLLAKFDRSMNLFAMDLSLSIAASSILSGLWLICLCWYQAMPQLGNFYRLLDMNLVGVSGILIRYPKIVKYVIYVHVVLLNVLSFLFLVILPAAIRDSESRRAFDKSWAFAVFLIIASFYFLFNVLVVFLWNIVEKLKSNVIANVQHIRFDEALTSFRFILVAHNLMTPFASAIFFLLTISDEVYIFLGLVGIDGHLGAWIVFFMIVTKFAGEKYH